VLAVCLTATLLAGCGYRVLRYGSDRSATVAIVTLDNDSVEPGVELTVTRALRQEFLRQGGPPLVSDPGRADFVIRGRVLPLETYSDSFSTVALAVEYRVRMTLSLEVQGADGQAVDVDRAALTGTELYLASADVEAGRKNRREALQRIADVLAARIHDAVGLHLFELPAAVLESGSEQEPS
jgi:hypothetical protein